MCGRFTIRAAPSIIAEQFALYSLPSFPIRFNVAPSQPVPVVRAESDGTRNLSLLHWGLIPHWAADASVGNRMINARSETAADKPAFRTAMRERRCLIVADGFYEWPMAEKIRRPYFIHMRDDAPFGFAGLWESWKADDQTIIDSCTILTTTANDLSHPIHDRMPLKLNRDVWNFEQIQKLRDGSSSEGPASRFDKWISR
jgi:putative SOS response-associated peptidase YedK